MGDTDKTSEGESLSSASTEALALSRRERIAFDAIREQSEMLAEAYRTILSLTRPGDREPLAPILAMHLCRELINALPGVFGIPKAPRVQYERVFNRLSTEWPKRDGKVRRRPPETAVALLAALLDEHEGARPQRSRMTEMIAGVDPARRGYVGPAGLAQWEDLHDRAQAVTHRLMNPNAAFPDPATARAVANDLTDALFGIFGPFLDTTDAIDDLLATPAPTLADAQRLVALMKTPSQEDHVFSNVALGWFPALSQVKSIFEPPPEMLPADEPGWFWEPTWPAARLLRRLAPTDPDGAIAGVDRALTRRNRFVVDAVLDVLLAVPVPIAAAKLAKLTSWPEPAQVSLMSGRKITDLAVQLMNGGASQIGLRIERKVLRSLWSAGGDGSTDWLIEESLHRFLSGFASSAPVAIADCLYGITVEALGPAHDTFDWSLQWLPRFDREPEFGPRDGPWRFLLALYTVVLAQPADCFRRIAAKAYKQTRAPLRRLAVALLAERPEDAPELVTSVLRDPVTWDRKAPREFRSLLGRCLPSLDTVTRSAVICYAKEARPVVAWHDRLVADGVADPPRLKEMLRTWRSELLADVREALTDGELAELGPLVDVIREEEIDEPQFVPTESPRSSAEINEMGPAGFAAFVRAWEPPRNVFGSNESTLGQELKSAVQDSPELWTANLADLTGLDLLYLTEVMLGLVGAAAGGSVLLWDHVFEWIENAIEAAPDSASRSWRADAQLAAIGAVGACLDQGSAQIRSATLSAASRLLENLVDSEDPTPEKDSADQRSGAAPFSSGMGSVRGQAVVTAARLLFATREQQAFTGRLGLEAKLMERVSQERSAAVWASFGRSLPWLLTLDSGSWSDALFGARVGRALKDAVWTGYIAVWNPKTIVAMAVPQCYEMAAAAAATPPPSGHDALDLRRRIGQHLAMLATWGVPDDARIWLDRFLELAPAEVVAETARFITDSLTLADLSDRMADRVISILRDRVSKAGQSELMALGWASRSSVRQRDVFLEIVAPAVIAGRGAQDHKGVMAALVAFVDLEPLTVARVLSVMVNEDKWDGLAHLAAAELRAALEALLVRPEPEAASTARKAINTLAARGHREYADLVKP